MVDNPSQEHIMLLGFGDIARRLVPHLRVSHRHYCISGVRRSTSQYDDVTMHAVDCRDTTSLTSLLTQQADVIVMTFVPTAMSDEGYQAGYVDTVHAVLSALDQQNYQPRLLMFVSSSSVYSQNDASWVNEDSATEPLSYSGRHLLKAEQLLADSRYTHCCVRFSGIYGPGRGRLINEVIEGKGSPAKPALYTNRIHSEDCAAILAHFIERQKTTPLEPVYLASDCCPTPLSEVKEWIAQTLNLPEEHLQHKSKQVNASRSRKNKSNKRCSNQRLLETGYTFLYPTFREGYLSLIDQQ